MAAHPAGAAAAPVLPPARPLVRAYDLGGSGLRTWLALVEPATRAVTPITACAHLGKCSRGRSGRGATTVEDARAWLRACVPSLELEVAAGVPQCFALASLEKLWAENETHERPSRKPEAIAELFGLPPALVYVVHDAEAHLVAGRAAFQAAGLPLPVLHCTIGTSISVAALRQDGSFVAFGNFIAACGCAPWDLTVGGKPAWTVMSGGAPAGERAGGVHGPAYGLWLLKDEEAAAHPAAPAAAADAAVAKFQRRWEDFLTHTATRPSHEGAAAAATGLVPLLLPVLGDDGCSAVTVVVTGGALDHHPKLFPRGADAAVLTARHPVGGHEVKIHVMAGPPDAGLRGASLLPFLPPGQH